jgi:hypothetical protein
VLRRSTAGSSEPEVPPPSSPSGPPTLLSRLHALALLAWSRVIRPLRDFGFGRRNIWEGGVGLFVVGGFGASRSATPPHRPHAASRPAAPCAQPAAPVLTRPARRAVMLGLVIGWIRGLNFQRTRSYQAIFEFPLACGIQVGTPVRVRGVGIGSVLSVRPSLEQVDVLVEIDDVAIRIPRNSLVEANQSGLIAETLIDITPRKPLPKAKLGPLDSGCEAEGAIVCDRGRVVGVTGVSLDALVAVCTRLALEVESLGMARMWAIGADVQAMIASLAPLVSQAEAIAAEVRPLLGNVREGELLASVEKLAESAAATAADVRKLNSAILTEENTELLRQSVGTLTKTLQHVEAVSGDVASLTGDPATRQNLRQLIQSLSRLVD